MPALGLAWLVVPLRLLDPVVEAKRLSDGYTGLLEQLTLDEFITSGGYDRHVRRSRLRYRRRRDQLLAGPGRAHVGHHRDRHRRRTARRGRARRSAGRGRARHQVPGRASRAGHPDAGLLPSRTRGRTCPRPWSSATRPRPRTPTRVPSTRCATPLELTTGREGLRGLRRVVGAGERLSPVAPQARQAWWPRPLHLCCPPAQLTAWLAPVSSRRCPGGCWTAWPSARSSVPCIRACPCSTSGRRCRRCHRQAPCDPRAGGCRTASRSPRWTARPGPATNALRRPYQFPSDDEPRSGGDLAGTSSASRLARQPISAVLHG